MDPTDTLPHDAAVPGAAVDLYWLPLGAGDRCVRWSGRSVERVLAGLSRREPNALYHAALEVHLDGARVVLEMAPEWDRDEPSRGVVCAGPVGLRWLGRSRWFRYEVRCWHDGVLPDAAFAVDSPRRVSATRWQARQVLDLVATVPALTWGRDELGAGAMWNSNSLVAWLLARSGHDMTTLAPPAGGRAPGWRAGLVLAARQEGVGTAPLPC